MPRFDYLKDAISFSFSKCDIKTGIKKVTLEKKRTNHFEQTLKLLKCEEKINCLHDFFSRPSIRILRINRLVIVFD